jgi:hypothetical protein
MRIVANTILALAAVDLAERHRVTILEALTWVADSPVRMSFACVGVAATILWPATRRIARANLAPDALSAMSHPVVELLRARQDSGVRDLPLNRRREA